MYVRIFMKEKEKKVQRNHQRRERDLLESPVLRVRRSELSLPVCHHVSFGPLIDESDTELLTCAGIIVTVVIIRASRTIAAVVLFVPGCSP